MSGPTIQFFTPPPQVSDLLFPTGGPRFSLRFEDMELNGVKTRREVRILQMHSHNQFGHNVWRDVPTVDHREKSDG